MHDRRRVAYPRWSAVHSPSLILLLPGWSNRNPSPKIRHGPGLIAASPK